MSKIILHETNRAGAHIVREIDWRATPHATADHMITLKRIETCYTLSQKTGKPLKSTMIKNESMTHLLIGELPALAETVTRADLDRG